MDIYIMNKSFERLGLIEGANIIWTSKYYDVGDFEIYVEANEKNISLLQAGNYAYRMDDENIGIIEKIKIGNNDEEEEYITATGRFSESILERRIVWEQTLLSGTVEKGLRKLVTENIINPSISDRKIENIILGTLKGYSDVLEAQYTGDNILEIHKKVSLASQIGFKLKFNFDFDNPIFSHELYKGIDRSYNQKENSFVVFSDEYDNLLTSEYECNISNIKNVALVAGEGEGKERKTAVVGSATGLERREIFVDARNLSTNSGEISATEYNNALKEKGLENISTITQAFSGEVDLGLNYKFKKDFFLGDIVTIKNEKWGIYINSRITQVIEVEDESGYKITPTFGS